MSSCSSEDSVGSRSLMGGLDVNRAGICDEVLGPADRCAWWSLVVAEAILLVVRR